MSVIHGHKRRGQKSPEYRVWLGIKRRCTDKKCKDYKNYGKRGISVCERWNSSFVNFLADMGPRPHGYTIDRHDSNGNYEPGNCRWAPAIEQTMMHKRGLVEVEVDGMKFHSLSAACRHFGVPKTRVHFRMKAGIPMKDWFKDEWLPRRRDRLSFLPKNHPDRQKAKSSPAP